MVCMEPETAVMCAALWTGLVWSFGVFSTWLAVKPMRRRLEMLDAWTRRASGFFQEAGEETSRWAGRVDALLEAHGDVLNAHQERLESLCEDAESLKCTVQSLCRFAPDGAGSPVKNRLSAGADAVKPEHEAQGGAQ